MGWSRFRIALEITALVMAILACASIIWVIWSKTANPLAPGSKSALARQPQATLPTEPIAVDGLPAKGSLTAAVEVVEFSDFQCPYCRQFSETVLPTIDRDYVQTGKVRIVFESFPLQIHKDAQPAAVAAACAARQNAFWPMHDALFASQSELSATSLERRARTLGLDFAAFTQCQAKDGLEDVRRDMAEGNRLGVGGTPTFFVGTRQANGHIKVTNRFAGGLPVTDFESMLDHLLETTKLPTK